MTIITERHTVQILDGAGHSETSWDPSNADEVAAARAVFDNLKSKGYVAYTVGEGDGSDEVLHRFDPAVGRMVLHPPQAGG